MRNIYSLAGKTILVTGASSGIGLACARQIDALGGTVILTARRVPELEAIRVELSPERPHRVIAGDLSDPDFIARLVAEAGPLDGLVHAAGSCLALPIGLFDEKALDDAMRVNYNAFMHLMKAYAKRRLAKDGFSAVAVSSVSVEAGWAGGSLYAGSKGALTAAVKSLAIELAPRARVNAVLPSNIKTPLFDELAGDLNDAAGMTRLKERQVLGIGTPEQVAGPVCFLLSAAASFVTGAALPVDGGYLAH